MKPESLALSLLALSTARCVTPATEVLVTVEASADFAASPPPVLRAFVERGAGSTAGEPPTDAQFARCVTANASGAGNGADCAVTTDAGVHGRSRVGTFAVVPRTGGPRDEDFRVWVELQSSDGSVLRRAIASRLHPGETAPLSVVLEATCDRVMTGTVCGTGSCTQRQLCEQRTLVCVDVVGRCEAPCGDGVCSAEENHCTCPSDCAPRAGDGCCDPGEAVDTEPACGAMDAGGRDVAAGGG